MEMPDIVYWNMTERGLAPSTSIQTSSNNFCDLQLDEWNIDVDFYPSLAGPSTIQQSNVPPHALFHGLFSNCQINNLHAHLK